MAHCVGYVCKAIQGWPSHVIQRIRGFLKDMRYTNSRFTYLLTYLHQQTTIHCRSTVQHNCIFSDITYKIVTTDDYKIYWSSGLLISQYKKAVLSQRWPRDAPYTWGPWIFGTPWLRPRLLFPTFFMGFCSDRPYECSYKTWIPLLYPFLR